MNGADTRIVQMQFDNEQFEKGIKESLTSLDKLKTSLHFDGASDGMDMLKKGASKLSNSIIDNVNAMATRFNSLGTVAGKVLDMIKTKIAQVEYSAVQFVENMSLGQVNAGLSKYEEKMTSVRTILAATAKEGKTLEDVDDVLSRLNKYTDQTSYGFTEMTNTIGKFTAAGVDLNTAEKAMEGIANWAAESGVSARNVTPAFYNLAQAIGAGSLKMQDWKSIENVNMATTQFKQTLIDAGVAMGTLKKQADGTYKTIGNKTNNVTNDKKVDVASMGQSLTYGWATKDVLLKALGTYYVEDLDVGEENIKELNEQLAELQEQYDKTTKKTEKAALAQKIQAKQTEIQTAKAYMAAREAKSFTDVIDALKDAVSTGWMNSFELIFGNVDQASVFFTDLADKLITVSNVISDKRNKILEGWNFLGGRDSLLGAFDNLWDGLSKLVGPIGTAFDEVLKPFNDRSYFVGAEKNFKYLENSFGDVPSNWRKVDGWSYYLKQITDGVAKFAEDFNNWFDKVDENGVKNFDKIQKIATGIASVFGILWKAGSKVSSVISDVFGKNFGPIVDVVVDKVSQIADKITEFNENLDIDNSPFGRFMDKIGEATNGALADFPAVLSEAGDTILAILDSEAIDELGGLADVLGEIFGNLIALGGEAVTGAISFVSDIAKTLFGIGDASEAGEEVAEAVDAVTDAAEEADPDQAFTIADALAAIAGAIDTVKTAVKNGFDKVKEFFTNVINFVKESKIVKTVGGAITSFFTDISKALSDLFANDKPLLERVGNFFSGIWTTISNVFSEENIKSAWTFIKDGFSKLFAWLGGVFSTENLGKLWESIKSIGVSIWSWISGIFSTENLTAVWDSIKAGATSIWTWISDTWQSIDWGSLGQSILDIGTTITDFLMGIFSEENITSVKTAVTDFAKKVWASITSVFNNVNGEAPKSIGEAFSNLWNNIINGITDLFSNKNTRKVNKAAKKGSKDVEKSIFESFADWLANNKLVQTVVGWINETATSIWNGFTALFNGPEGQKPETVFEGIKNFGINIWNSISQWFENSVTVKTIGNWINNAVTSIWNNIKSIFNGPNGEEPTSVLDAIKNFGKNVWDEVTGWFENNETIQSVISWIDEKATAIWSSITSLFDGPNGEKPETIWDGITNFGKNIWDKITEWYQNDTTVQSVVGWIDEKATTIWNSIKSFIFGTNVETDDGGEQKETIFTKLWNTVSGWFDSSDGSESILTKVKTALATFWENIKKLFAGNGQDVNTEESTSSIDDATATVEQTSEKMNIFQKATETIKTISESLIGKIDAANPLIDKVFSKLFEFAAIKLILGVSSLASGIGNKLSGKKVDSFSDKMNSLAAVITSIAIAIGVCAAAIFVLGNMDTDALGQGVGAIIGIIIFLGVLIGGIAVLMSRVNAADDMISKDGKGAESHADRLATRLQAMAGVLTGIAIAVGTFAAVVLVFGQYLSKGNNWTHALLGLLALVVIVGALLGTIKLLDMILSKGNVDSEAVAAKMEAMGVLLKSVAIAIGVMAAGVLLIGGLLSWEQMWKGVIAIGLCAAIIVGIIFALNKIFESSNNLKGNIGPVIVVVIGAIAMIVALGFALNQVKDMDFGQLAGFALAMGVMAVLVVAIAGVFKILDGVNIDIGKAAKLAIAIGVFILILSAIMSISASLISGGMQSMAAGITDFGSGLLLAGNQMTSASAAWESVNQEILKSIPNLVKELMTGINEAGLADAQSQLNNLVRVASSLNLFASLTEGLTNLDGLQSFVRQLGLGVIAPLMAITSGTDALDNVITKLTELGGAVRLFFSNVSTGEGETNLMMNEDAINVDSITTMFSKLNEIVEAIPDDAKTEIQNGINSLPTEDTVASFSAQLSALGGAIIQFASDCESAKDADLSKATTVLSMVETIKTKLSGSTSISGGVFGWAMSSTTGDLTTFSTDLTALGGAVSEFIKACKGANGDGLNDSDLETATKSIEILGELSTKLPSVGGLKSLVVGTSGLGNLAVGMTSLGSGVVAFLKALDPEKSDYTYNKDRVDQAVDMVRVLGGVFKALPSSGGLVSLFSGNASFADLANGLGELGTQLNLFYKNVPNIDNPDRLSSIMDSVVKLGESGEHLEKAYNFANRISDLSSETKLGSMNGSSEKTVSKLELFGIGLTKFYDSVSTITDTDHFDNVLSSTRSLAEIFEILQSTKDAHKRITDLFGNGDYSKSPIARLAEGLAAFNDSANEIVDDGGNTLTALTNFKTLAEGLNALPKDINISSDLSGQINDALGQIRDVDWSILSSDSIPGGAGSIVSSIASVLNTNANDGSLTQAGNNIVSNVLSGMDVSGFQASGRYAVVGFARGISLTTYLATAAARTMAKKTILAANEELDEHSPSKVFYRIGEFVDQGFANGISDSTNIVTKAMRTVTDGVIGSTDDIFGSMKALSGVNLAEAFDGSSPTIRPIIDMSDIEAKSGSIFGLLGSMTEAQNIPFGASLSSAKASGIGYGGRAPSSPYATDNSGLIASVNELGDKFDKIAERMEHLEVVLDTGAAVGALAPKVDRALGRTFNHHMRGIAT